MELLLQVVHQCQGSVTSWVHESVSDGGGEAQICRGGGTRAGYRKMSRLWTSGEGTGHSRRQAQHEQMHGSWEVSGVAGDAWCG